MYPQARGAAQGLSCHQLFTVCLGLRVCLILFGGCLGVFRIYLGFQLYRDSRVFTKVVMKYFLPRFTSGFMSDLGFGVEDLGFRVLRV